MFHGVIQKIKLAQSFLRHGVFVPGCNVVDLEKWNRKARKSERGKSQCDMVKDLEAIKITSV